MDKQQSPWQPDILGADFQVRFLDLGPDPDNEGEAIASVVRYLPADSVVSSSQWQQRPAVLWVHGMTDYFFHEHVAKRFHDEGYAFYAVDLRKCGRSHQPGQRWHHTTDLRHYFPDLTAATTVLSDEGHSQIIPLAHSTGGLVVPLWLDDIRQRDPNTFDLVPAVMLNSPWLDMQFPPWMVNILRPVVRLAAPLLPNLQVDGGGLGAYGASIHSSARGEWSYDLTMKPLGGHPKHLSWLAAVLAGQHQVHSNAVDVGVPLLTLCSDSSELGKVSGAAGDSADMVLDVEQIRAWSPFLGDDVTVRSIDGARHDVFLSLPYAREESFSTTFGWLTSTLSRL